MLYNLIFFRSHFILTDSGKEIVLFFIACQEDFFKSGAGVNFDYKLTVNFARAEYVNYKCGPND